MSDLRLIRGASPSRHGGIHWYEWKPKDEALVGPADPDLFLLHPIPHDGAFFTVIAPFLAAGRTVIAPDYPGYGRSDGYPETPSIAVYAEAMIDVLRRRDTRGPADLFGFHTGCLVAVEMSLQFPSEVHRLVQVDVPYFDPAARREMLGQDWAVGGFVAAFSYESEKRYRSVKHDSLVIATDSSLAKPSRRAAAAMRNCQLEEMPDVKEPALESGAVPISTATLKFLDQ